MCAVYNTLPSRCSHTGNLVVEHQSTICVGGAEVRHGTLDGLRVTVKSILYNSTGSSGGLQEVSLKVQILPHFACSHCRQSAYREVITWKHLSHPNISPFLGIDTSTSSLSVISVLAEHGSLTEYLLHFPNASRSKLVT